MMAGRLRGPHGQPSKNLHQQHEIHLHQISTVLTAKGRSFENAPTDKHHEYLAVDVPGRINYISGYTTFRIP